MASRITLAIDVVLSALIGPPNSSADLVIARGEAGEWQPVLLDFALFCAMASVRPEDRVDHARFAKLLRYSAFAASGAREPGTPFEPPSADAIEHWRNVVFGRDEDA